MDRRIRPMEFHVTFLRDVIQYFGSGFFSLVWDSSGCELSIHAVVVTFLISLSVKL